MQFYHQKPLILDTGISTVVGVILESVRGRTSRCQDPGFDDYKWYIKTNNLVSRKITYNHYCMAGETFFFLLVDLTALAYGLNKST